MAGPLGVTHLLLFSRSPAGNTNLRIALTPRGPTLHFRVEKYSLCKDVSRALKHPKGGGLEFQTPPLLVMNNFSSPPPADGETPVVPKHLESLTTTVFQSLFPAIAPQTMPLSSVRRVLLLNRETTKPRTDGDQAEAEEGSYVINVRQYAITTKATGVSKSIHRLNAAEKVKKMRGKGSGVPNLGKLNDVAEYFLDPSAAAGFTSASESEAETDAEVEVLDTTARKVLSKKRLDAQRRRSANGESAKSKMGPWVEKRAIKLVELGPRMKLRMTKVEEGLCTGKVLWHEYLSKSQDEVKEMERVWEERRRVKEERKRVQRENVERKRKERGEGESEGDQKGEGGGEKDGEEDWASEEFEDYDMNDGDDDVGDDMDVDGPLEVPAG